MDTQRILERDTTHKRRLEEGFLDFFHDDLKPCKYLKVAVGGESQPIEKLVLASKENCRRASVQQDALNFQRSGIPTSFQYYYKGKWKDFAQDLLPSIVKSFVAREGFTRFSIQDKVYVMSFVYMIQVNLHTGLARSIAWIDGSGRRYTPSKCIEQSCKGLLSKTVDGRNLLAIEALQGDAKLRNFDSGLLTSSEKTTACGLATGTDFDRLGDKLIKLAENEQEFIFARDKFLSGFSLFAKDTAITGVYKTSHTSISAQARLQAFNIQEEISAATRGDCNLRYAWHGTSKEGVMGIIRHGFGQPRVPKNGDAFGVGVYLAPEDSSHVSAMYSDVDENGEQHIVLCKVIMGRSEQVVAGSQQFHPSSEDFDTGVDDATRPKRYIVWSTHMNTHILPIFVISFKLSTIVREVIIAAQRGKQALRECATRLSKRDYQCITEAGMPTSHCAPTGQCGESLELAEHSLHEIKDRSYASGVTSVCGDTTTSTPCHSRLEEDATSTPRVAEKFTNGSSHSNVPRSPWISFPELFPLLESKLEPQAMNVLQKLHVKFQVGRLPRTLFVKMIRRMLGDDFLRECIKNRSVHAMSTCDTKSFCG